MADTKIRGRVEKITFFSEESGFAIIKVKADELKKVITVVGPLAGLSPGELVELYGSFLTHPKFGEQFQADSFVSTPPTHPQNLKKYLGSGLIKGIGPVFAARMVDHFGQEILDILDNDPQRLTEIPGLGATRREMIINAWKNTAGLKRLLNFLTQFGLGPAAAIKITKTLGDNAEELIKADPYRLAYEVDGIGFLSADKVAKSLGIAPDSLERFQGAIAYVLLEASKQGHVYLAFGELYERVKNFLPLIEHASFNEALGKLLLKALIVTETGSEPNELRVYLPKLHKAENWVAKSLVNIVNTASKAIIPRPKQAIEWAESKFNLSLAPLQREAVYKALNEKCLIVTGGPGTGKTTVTKLIANIFKAVSPRLALAAPTGRAAKRLSQATGFEAKTIHRLLEFSSSGQGFVKGASNKLDLDYIIIDEASMIDINLFNRLVSALPYECTLIIIGDKDQLPSIGPGKVLADLIESKVIPYVELKEIYRQAETSQIIQAAYQINNGFMPNVDPKNVDSDFYLIFDNNIQNIKKKLITLIKERIPEKFFLDPLEDIQVLTPMHQGDLGTEALNDLLSPILNTEPGLPLNRFNKRFRVGDKIMQLRNNYDKEVFNGDLGKITKIDHTAQEIVANFDNNIVVYDFSELDELSLAYAISVHKSQGSEFPAVIIPIIGAHYIMLKRNLLYTAVTRGRKCVIVIGEQSAIKRAILNDQEMARNSGLSEKLQKSVAGAIF